MSGVKHTTAADGTFTPAGAAAWDAEHTLSDVASQAGLNATAAAVDVVSNALSILSNTNSVDHAALSGRITSVAGLGGVGSVTSTELSSAAATLSLRADALSNAVSIVSQALSLEAAALSVRIDTNGNLISALTSAHNALSNQVSNLISAGGGGTSVTSNELSVLLNSYSARSGGVSTHGLQSVLNALSNRISAGGGGSVTSNELSAAAVVLSVRVDSVANAVSVATSGVLAALNALSVLSQANSVEHAALSVRVDTASALATTADTHANTASAAATSVDARVNTVSNGLSVANVSIAALSQALSVLSQANSVTHAALSLRIDTASALATTADTHAATASAAATSVDAHVNTVSTAASNALSVANAASNAASVVSQALSLLSNTNSTQHAALSARIDTTSLLVTTTNNNEVSARQLLEKKTYSRPNICPSLDKWDLGPFAVVNDEVWGTYARTTNVAGAGTAAATSPMFKVTPSLTYTISGDSQVETGSGAVYFDLQFLDAALAIVLDSSQNVVGGVHSFSTTDVNRNAHAIAVVAPADAVWAQARFIWMAVADNEAIAFRQVKVELGDLPQTTYSNELGVYDSVSNALSVANAASNAVSVLSQANSVAHAALSVRVDTLSNVVSNIISAGGGGTSVTSNELSVILNGYSARTTAAASIHGIQSIFNALSNRISAGGGASGSIRNPVGGGGATSVQGLQSILNAISNTLSNAFSAGNVNSNAISVISVKLAGHGLSAQYRTRTGVTVVSAATLTNIPSLSISVEPGGMYKLDGMVMFECATSGGFAFGFSAPALGADGSYFRMWTTSIAYNQATAIAGLHAGHTAMSAVAAAQTALVSVSIATVNVMRHLMFEGFMNVSTAGTGSFQLMAKTSVAAASMSVRGGYIRAVRLA